MYKPREFMVNLNGILGLILKKDPASPHYTGNHARGYTLKTGETPIER